MKTKLNSGPKRCAIYIRVSTAMQRMEGWSLDAQRASLTAFAQGRGWKVIGVYADEGQSARKRLKNRKAIFSLLDDVRAGLVDVILFKELDRWFRNVSDFYKVQEILDAAGVTWVSERQPTLDMSTKEGRLNVNVLLSVGQNEADSTSDRIKYTNKYLRSQKRFTSGKRSLPRGFTIGEGQRVIIDPEQEAYVRTLIAHFRSLGSVQGALKATNREFQDNYLYASARSLLSNPLLWGCYREVPDFMDQSYMTQEEFDQLQKLIRVNAYEKQGNFYIFTRLVRCSTCGKAMIGNTIRRSGKTYIFYRCSWSSRDGICSNNLTVPEPALENALIPYIRESIQSRIVEVRSIHQSRIQKPRKSNRAAIEKQLDKLEDLYISSDRMTRERYEEKRLAILANLIEDEPEEVLPQIADLERIQSYFDGDMESTYHNFSPEERREFWRGILRSIYVKGKKIEGVDFLE